MERNGKEIINMAVCEGCEQEKDVTDVEGSLLCEECAEDVVRCAFCNKLVAINMKNLRIILEG